MKPLPVVEVEVFVQTLDGLGDTFVVVQIDLFVFDAAPEPLNEDVVQCSATSIHTDGDLSLFENTGESAARELNTLIRIEDFRRRLFQSLIQGARAEIRFQRGRHFPRQDIPRMPVNHRDQVNEAALQSDIRDVGTPDLIDTFDLHASQQVRVNLMTGAGLRQPRLLIDCFQAHQPQQACDSFVIDLITLRLKPGGHSPNAVERRPRVLFVEQAHQLQVLFALRLRLVIKACARQTDQFTLSGKTQQMVIGINQQALFFRGTIQLFF
jgi:hypothetical protein